MLRENYYVYIYENYIRELPLSNEEKIEQTMRMHHLKSEVLQNYINDNIFSKDEIEIFKEWENEIYGEMHIVYVYDGRAIIYCEQTDQVYDAKLSDRKFLKELKTIPFYIKVYGSIFKVQNKQYFDCTISLVHQKKLSISEIEDLYEHIHELVLTKPLILKKCQIFSERK